MCETTRYHPITCQTPGPDSLHTFSPTVTLHTTHVTIVFSAYTFVDKWSYTNIYDVLLNFMWVRYVHGRFTDTFVHFYQCKFWRFWTSLRNLLMLNWHQVTLYTNVSIWSPKNLERYSCFWSHPCQSRMFKSRRLFPLSGLTLWPVAVHTALFQSPLSVNEKQRAALSSAANNAALSPRGSLLGCLLYIQTFHLHQQCTMRSPYFRWEKLFKNCLFTVFYIKGQQRWDCLFNK